MSGWKARLELEFRRDGAATRSRDRHLGPLRVLQPLYPEGPGICHQVLVHPPGGLVGGDTVELEVHVGAGAHALITTPGATRWYRSDGAPACQSVRLALATGARLEWLPLESIAHSGCQAVSRLRAALAPGAEMMGWDLLALGLPASAQPYAAGCYRQHLEVEGLWIERAAIAAADRTLLDAAPGWDGQRVLATLWFAAGAALEAPRRERLLEVARACA
ncbi:MAG: urease accessory protein UreD, partial [Burkholderiales bacterium]|nr:urease accessory protein UreD [Burkholderiales bacterium]